MCILTHKNSKKTESDQENGSQRLDQQFKKAAQQEHPQIESPQHLQKHLKSLNDKDLLSSANQAVATERSALTQVLHHLREIERRRLYSDLGYQSLFDYCVGELKYSEGAASRRVQAMRLFKELPELEEKIASGRLSLTNLAQARGLFRNLERSVNAKQIGAVGETRVPGRRATENDLEVDRSSTRGEIPHILTPERKMEILERLEGKSSRDGQCELNAIQQDLGLRTSLPKEKEWKRSDGSLLVTFRIGKGLQDKLETVRSLLGPEGLDMSLTDLFEKIADLAALQLRAKRFGKKRSQANDDERERADPSKTHSREERAHANSDSNLGLGLCLNSGSGSGANFSLAATPAPVSEVISGKLMARTLRSSGISSASAAASSVGPSSGLVAETATGSEAALPQSNPGDATSIGARGAAAQSANSRRYIAKSVKDAVWDRDGGKCMNCGAHRNLNFDHVTPVSLGGSSSTDNIRLLCFHCNQRAAIKTFGISAVSPKKGANQ